MLVGFFFSNFNFKFCIIYSFEASEENFNNKFFKTWRIILLNLKIETRISHLSQRFFMSRKFPN